MDKININKINILDRSVSELIAAGEVIERPASVVKELVENSIDAGATKIRIEIKNGGVTYIKITDNGVGIRREDVKKAFLRHATSKVSSAVDLDNILTLGFRGEALASISAVSKIEIITRTKDELDATRYFINFNNNKERELEEIGAPVGTTIIIRDLFFNVPARMKFLKKDVTEGNAIATIIDRLALSHPEISFVFIREGQEKLSTCGDNNLLAAIYCVFGSQFASSMLSLKYTENNINISGYISSPSNTRASRSMQTFFVNSRYVKSKTCCAALEEAFKSFITSNKFPACVLNIEIPSSVIDINVHPAKLEIRFANEKKIYDLVYSAVKNCLLSNSNNPVMNLKNNFNNNILDQDNKDKFKNKIDNLINNSLVDFSKINNSKNNKFYNMSSLSSKLESLNNNFINQKNFETVVKEINKSFNKLEKTKNSSSEDFELIKNSENTSSGIKSQEIKNIKPENISQEIKELALENTSPEIKKQEIKNFENTSPEIKKQEIKNFENTSPEIKKQEIKNF
ncbi:MAG: DNA mismatch repair endonuclease MutL, partial [Oscillospiraceae bacterium]|nr:DNA mismatch repair endonuclease MutL [Oscillospiraceae bacterium]